MIFTERTIKVNNDISTISNPIILYRGDYNVEVRFTILDCPYKYSENNSTNVIETVDAYYCQLVIKVPNDRPPIFSDIVETKEGCVIFTFSGEMIDESIEVGDYTFQIRLFDANQKSRATIPPVENGIKIREPIAFEDVTTTNEVGKATVGYATTTAGTPEDAFDSESNYNKTTWEPGDRITAAKLDKMEAGIDGVNKKVNKIGYLLSDFNEYVVDDDWTPAVHKAIEVANANNGRVLVDGMYTIKSQITVPTNTTIEGYGFTFGVCGFTLVTPGITAVEIRGVAITFKNIVVKASSRFEVETHGIVFSSENTPDTNLYHGFCNIRDVRVANFNGYGIKFDSIQDSLVENISIEKCGNSNCYAFWVGSTSDTSNHSNFNRVQVERSHVKSMYVAISTLCCVFTNIHSERVLEIDQSIYTHDLSGSNCTYQNARIENSSSVDTERPRLSLGGPNTVYESILTDAFITNIKETNRITTFFNNCKLRNVKYRNIATASFNNCDLNGIDVAGETININNSKVANMIMGSSPEKSTKYFNNCTFINMGYNAAYLNAYFNSCEFKVSGTEATTLKLSPVNYFDNCNFICPTKIAYDRRIVIKNSILKDLTFEGEKATVTLMNNIITTFTRKDNNTLTWINNHYTGTFTQKDGDYIVLLDSSHTHTNKDVLDQITSDKITQYDSLFNIEEVTIVDSTLTLTNARLQKVAIANNIAITLPVVAGFAEIHLFFDTTEDITLNFTNTIKWQSQPTFTANKSYELVFTKVGETWLGGAIV